MMTETIELRLREVDKAVHRRIQKLAHVMSALGTNKVSAEEMAKVALERGVESLELEAEHGRAGELFIHG